MNKFKISILAMFFCAVTAMAAHAYEMHPNVRATHYGASNWQVCHHNARPGDWLSRIVLNAFKEANPGADLSASESYRIVRKNYEKGTLLINGKSPKNLDVLFPGDKIEFEIPVLHQPAAPAHKTALATEKYEKPAAKAHTANIHDTHVVSDSPFKDVQKGLFGEKSSQLKVREAYRSLVDYAVKEDVDPGKLKIGHFFEQKEYGLVDMVRKALDNPKTAYDEADDYSIGRVIIDDKGYDDKVIGSIAVQEAGEGGSRPIRMVSTWGARHAKDLSGLLGMDIRESQLVGRPSHLNDFRSGWYFSHFVAPAIERFVHAVKQNGYGFIKVNNDSMTPSMPYEKKQIVLQIVCRIGLPDTDITYATRASSSAGNGYGGDG